MIASAEALGVPAAHTDIRGGSITLAIILITIAMLIAWSPYGNIRHVAEPLMLQMLFLMAGWPLDEEDTSRKST